jgi:hypothetical protein
MFHQHVRKLGFKVFVANGTEDPTLSRLQKGVFIQKTEECEAGWLDWFMRLRLTLIITLKSKPNLLKHPPSTPPSSGFRVLFEFSPAGPKRTLRPTF